MKKAIIHMMVTVLMIITIQGCASGGDRRVVKQGSYRGLYSFPLNINTMEILELEPRIIRNREEFRTFREGIPPFEMTKQSPAPVNEDPLLTLNTIDWSTRMMLVIFSHDENTFIDLSIKDVKIQKGVMTATALYRYPDPMAIYQKVPEMGFYFALIVDRFDGEVVFEILKEKDY